MRGRWFFRGAGFALLFILGIIVFGYVTMALWNALIPPIFHGPLITYWQALGLMILTRLLTGGFRRGWRGGWGCRSCGHHGGNHWKMQWKERLNEKIANMSPEEREKFLAKLKNRCGWDFPGEEPAQKTAE